MKFDVTAIIIMVIAVVVGQVGGGMIQSYFGASSLGGAIGTLAGILIIGALSYAVYALATGSKLSLTLGLLFAVTVYIANMIAGYMGAAVNIGAGFLTLIMAGLIAAFMWGLIGGRLSGKVGGKGKQVTPVKV